MSPAPRPETFLSGEAGNVVGPRLRITRTLADAGAGLVAAATLAGPRVARLADRQAPRRVLVVSAYRPGSILPDALAGLRSERHTVELSLGSIGAVDDALRATTVVEGLSGGKFENVNRVLAAGPSPADFDWTFVIDDDVRLPHRFTDRFVAVCERFGLDLAQPALTWRSHAAWRVTRRRPGAIARRTRFVEIGPVTCFRRAVAVELMPFPELRFGWGLDLHWAATAEARGWSLGVVDATPARHEEALIATGYSHEDAVAEAVAFLDGRAYLTSSEAQQTLATYRTLSG